MDTYGFKRTLQAEWLKLKGSGIWYLTYLLGIIFPVLFIGVTYFENDSFINIQNARLPFSWFKQQLLELITGFGKIFYPLSLVLLAARLAGLEHKTDTWKLMETQPVSRFSIWTSKLLVAMLLSAVVVLVFFIGMVLLGCYTWAFRNPPPEATFTVPVPYFLQLAFRIWLSGLGILILQYGLSVIMKSAIWPMVVGVVAVIATSIATGNSTGLVATFWPYALPDYTTRYPDGSQMGKWLLPAEWQSVAWVLLAPLLLLAYDQKGRVKSALKNWKYVALPLASLVLFALFSFLIQKPKKVELLQGRSVIAGKITTDSIPLPDSISIYSMPLEFEIAKAAIHKDGTFKTDLPLAGAVQQLFIRISFDFGNLIYAGEGDSIFLDWTIGKKNGLQKVVVTGTAMATNQYVKTSKSNYNAIRYMLEIDQNALPPPSEFYERLMNEWQEEGMRPSRFKTADGYGLGAVFKSLQEKLIAVRYIDYALLKYPEKLKKPLDDISIQLEMPKLQTLLKSVEEFDSTLVGWNEYHAFIVRWMVRDMPPTANRDSVYLQRLLLKPAGKARDRLLFDLTKNNLAFTRDSVSRAAILEQVANIQDPQFIEALQKQNDVLNRLRKGQSAPTFMAHLMDDTQVGLSSLKGKYIAIDVWASWCGPCLTQSPIFERMAKKYASDSIVFVALSVDENRSDWEQHLRKNYTQIAQWRANNLVKIRELYGLESIPRFMLIDPAGKFVNAQMPMPDDANFEILLRQTLGLKPEEG